jgi:hypothetical protein
MTSLPLALSLNNNNAQSIGRRKVLQQAFCGVSAATLLDFNPRESQAVISSKPCAMGVGEGCDDLAGGNEFIRSLQEKSASNKDAIQQEARNAYYMKNYPDWFQSVGKTMVKKADGSFMVVSDEELAYLKRANKLEVEIAKAKGGMNDLTQRPILVLKE